MAKWIVGGWHPKKGAIRDTVQGVDDIKSAMKKARKKYPTVPELSVRGMTKADRRNGGGPTESQ